MVRIGMRRLGASRAILKSSACVELSDANSLLAQSRGEKLTKTVLSSFVTFAVLLIITGSLLGTLPPSDIKTAIVGIFAVGDVITGANLVLPLINGITGSE